MSTPTHQHTFVRIIVYIIVTGYLNGQAFIQVTAILRIQCQRRIFRLPVTKNSRPPVPLPYIHQHLSTRKATSVPEPSEYLPCALPYDGYAAHRNISSKPRKMGCNGCSTMFKDTEHLLIQRILRHSIMMIKSLACAAQQI